MNSEYYEKLSNLAMQIPAEHLRSEIKCATLRLYEGLDRRSEQSTQISYQLLERRVLKYLTGVLHISNQVASVFGDVFYPERPHITRILDSIIDVSMSNWERTLLEVSETSDRAV